MPFVALNTNRNATNEGDMRKHQTYALVTLSEKHNVYLSKLTLLKLYFSIQNLKDRKRRLATENQTEMEDKKNRWLT